MDKLLTRRQLAEQLNVHINSIDNMVKRGMPVSKCNSIVRFDLKLVKKWLEKNK